MSHSNTLFAYQSGSSHLQPRLFQIPSHRILPVRQRREAGFYELALIQPVVRGPGGFAQSVLLSSNGNNPCTQPILPIKLHTEVIPRDVLAGSALAVSCVMVAVFLSLALINQQSGQIIAISRHAA